MFEMEETRTCSNCKWWEYDHRIKKKEGRIVKIGQCQAYDHGTPDWNVCCRHRFESEKTTWEKRES